MQKKYFHFHAYNHKNRFILGLFKKDELSWSEELRHYVRANAACTHCGKKINPDFSACPCGKKFTPNAAFLWHAYNYLEDPKADYSGEYYLGSTEEERDALNALIRKASRKIHAGNSSAKRKARMGAIEGGHTQEDIERLREIQNKCCYYCGSAEKALQVEHLVPVAKGGSHFISNIVLACARCNASKHSKTDSEFWKHLKKKYSPEWIKERKTKAKEIQKRKLRT